MSIITKDERRRAKHRRVRRKVSGSPERPRLSVHRSNKHIRVQIVDDIAGKVLLAASSQSKEIREQNKYGGNKKAARAVGALIAEKAKAQGISAVVFDRGGYLYHGRIREVAEGARQGGLKF